MTGFTVTATAQSTFKCGKKAKSLVLRRLVRTLESFPVTRHSLVLHPTGQGFTLHLDLNLSLDYEQDQHDWPKYVGVQHLPLGGRGVSWAEDTGEERRVAPQCWRMCRHLPARVEGVGKTPECLTTQDSLHFSSWKN